MRQKFTVELNDGQLVRRITCVPIKPRGWVMKEGARRLYGGIVFPSTAALHLKLAELEGACARHREALASRQVATNAPKRAKAHRKPVRRRRRRYVS